MIISRGKLLSPKCAGSASLQGKVSLGAEKKRSNEMDCPVQTRMPVAVRDGVGIMECQGLKSLVRRQPSRRRVFVQTDCGSVLGVELDRADNAHTLKKKMQMALHVPTEASALTVGDTVLTNDLSVVRNDSPLRLTRSFLHRSSSTPCLSPTPEGSQGDRSGPLEIVGGLNCCTVMKKMIKQAIKAIDRSVEPVPVKGGLGGAYYFRNIRGESIAIVKPTDEEPFAPNNPKGYVGKSLGQPGLKRSVRVGETGVREVAAYLLDHSHFAKVPPTVLVKISHSIFNVNYPVSNGKPPNHPNQPVSKIASFQQFVMHDFDASDHGSSSFSVSAVHRIGILDIRILNTDRHGGNILVKKPEKDFSRYAQVGDTLELIPIDHGLCLPETLEDPYFEWLHWPQASIPFSEEELEYINHLDANKDADMLRMELPMIREASLRILILCTLFLKAAANAGLCLAEIGEMMSREYSSGCEMDSELELICLQAKLNAEQKLIHPQSPEIATPKYPPEHFPDQFQLDIDHDEFFGNQGVKSAMLATARSLDLNNQDKDNNGFHSSINLPSPKKPFPSTKMPFSFECPSPRTPRGCPLSKLEEVPYLEGEDVEDDANQECVILEQPPMPMLPFNLPSPKKPFPSTKMPFSFECPSPRTPRGCPLSKLEEVPYLEGEDVEDDANQECVILEQPPMPTLPFMIPAKNREFGQVRRNSSNAGNWKGFSMESVANSRAAQSGHELSAVGPKVISFSDMDECEWNMFIENFQELLPEAIASRRKTTSGQRQRLGTSCQF